MDVNPQGLRTGARGWSKYAQFLLDFSKLIAFSMPLCSIAAKQPSPCSRFLEQGYTPTRDLLEWHLQYALGNATCGAYANQRHAPWLVLSSEYSAGLIVYNPCEFIGFYEALFLELRIVPIQPVEFLPDGSEKQGEKV